MMHTVEEARKLWCPMARVAAHFQWDFRNNVSFNRDPDGLTKQAYCIASDCMMWRWGDDFRVKARLCSDAFATTEPARPADLPADWYFVPASISLISPAQWAEPTNQSLKRRTGYCGLGGKP